MDRLLIESGLGFKSCAVATMAIDALPFLRFSGVAGSGFTESMPPFA